MKALCIGITYSNNTYLKFLRNNLDQKRNAVNLAHKIHGPALSSGNIPIFVLHGLLGTKKNWDSMSKKLSESIGTTVVTPDMRNHGESPHANTHEYVDLASDVSLLITTLNVAKAHIVGHSMGGRTGMVLALTEPTKVQSLTVVDISPVSTAGILNEFFPALLKVMKAINFSGLDAGKARVLAREKIMESGLIEHPALMHFILMSLGKKPDGTYGWLCNLDALMASFMSIGSFPTNLMAGKTYKGPTYFIGGALSNYIPPQDLPGIKGYFPTVILDYVKDVGHNVHAEDPNTFLRMATNFISRSK